MLAFCVLLANDQHVLTVVGCLFQGEGAYSSFNSQQGRGSSRHRSQHSSGRARAGRRRAGMRRRARVTDTISSVSGGQSAPRSRYLEINQYNDTVYLSDGKQRYSYYWEVNVSITINTVSGRLLDRVHRTINSWLQLLTERRYVQAT